MKIRIVKDVMKGDVSPVAMFCCTCIFGHFAHHLLTLMEIRPYFHRGLRFANCKQTEEEGGAYCGLEESSVQIDSTDNDLVVIFSCHQTAL